jgi:mono/diheme cytochrome c family protein
MKRLGPFLITLFAGAALAAVQTQSLPEGEGKKLVELQCSGCHGLNIVTIQHQDRDKWSAVVRRMVDFGTPLTAREVTIAVDYLAKNFGPLPPPAEPPNELERTAKKHIEGICSTCHTSTLIKETQASREEWLEIVKTMNSKGSGLSDVDVELLADYLARNYGKKP